MKKIVKSPFFVFLIIFLALIARIALVIEGVIPFTFDHAKDSLAILHIGKTLSPSLIGPWTSIPGIYFGPGWYYLLLPAYVIGGYHPLSAIMVMILILLIQVYLAAKYLNIWSALIIAFAPVWFIVSTSAWNPFPMTLITLTLMILLLRVRRSREILSKQAFLMGFVVSMGFHFSSAYAVLLPLIILFLIISWKIKLRIKPVLFGFMGGLIPFLPQIVFELRNNFVQTQAILNYFSTTQEVGLPLLEKIPNVIEVTVGELPLAFMPEIRGISAQVNKFFQLLLYLTILVTFIHKKLWRNKKIQDGLILVAGFIGIPMLSYFFLHFNVWYLYGMMPIAVYLVSLIIKRMNPYFKIFWAISLIICALSFPINFHLSNKQELIKNRQMLPIKQLAISTIRDIADGRPFSSYHYVPDIYDFSYQYLYIVDGLKGKQMPQEFAYEPNVTEYVVQKQDLLSLLSPQNSEPEESELVFFIVEDPENEDFLNQWWDRQIYSEIIEEKPLSSSVKLYVATP